jgi:hypothetical protein
MKSTENHPTLPAPDFPAFFSAVFGDARRPYDYQSRLAESACESRLISVPTGLGKTAAVVLAWLCNRAGIEIENPKSKIQNLAWPRRFFELHRKIRQSLIAESATLEKSQFVVGESGTQLPSRISSPVVTKLDQDPVGTEISAPPVRKLTERQPPALPVHKVLELSWTHLLEFIRLDDPWKRAFYENECLNGNRSVRQLQRQIGSLLYDRTALSTDKQEVINHARQQAIEAPAWQQHRSDITEASTI